MYEPVPSLDVLAERLAVLQQQFNEAVRGGAMDLVFFEVWKTTLMDELPSKLGRFLADVRFHDD